MRKIIFAIIGVMFIGGAFAADVAERTDCTATKEHIDKLAATENLAEADKALLADLRALHRKNCSVRAGGRGSRTIAGTRTAAATGNTSDATDAPVIAESCTNPDANGCCPGEEFADMGADGKFCCKDDYCFPPMAVTVAPAPAQPQKTDEEIAAEIAANIEKGLCGDGTKPNKYGCCSGELFKDLGNAEFACCKKDTNECFPPMK